MSLLLLVLLTEAELVSAGTAFRLFDGVLRAEDWVDVRHGELTVSIIVQLDFGS